MGGLFFLGALMAWLKNDRGLAMLQVALSLSHLVIGFGAHVVVLRRMNDLARFVRWEELFAGKLLAIAHRHVPRLMQWLGRFLTVVLWIIHCVEDALWPVNDATRGQKLPDETLPDTKTTLQVATRALDTLTALSGFAVISASAVVIAANPSVSLICLIFIVKVPVRF
jgi:hypothetical protein